MTTDANVRRIEYLDLDQIELAVRNPKAHDTEGIKRSISHFGLTEVPTLDGRTGRLVAGHGRIQDLRDRRTDGGEPPSGVQLDGDRWLVPVLCGWSSRSDEDAEAYLVASNNLSARGGWDNAELGVLLADLNDVDPDLLALTRFTDADVEALLSGSGGKPEPDPPEEFPEYDDETIPTEHECPACGYKFSGGKSSAAGGP